MITGLLVLGALACLIVAAVGFITTVTFRAANKVAQALKAAPSSGERLALALLLREIADDQIRYHLWVYDPRLQQYKPAADAAEISFRAREFGEAHVLRYDRELNEFTQTIVTPQMPVAEIME
jgi:hypothetical protein